MTVERPTEPPVPGPVVGLRREREVLSVALATHRHVVLEGPPGTGKSTLLRAVAAETGQDVVFVEGNAELTPARLIGQYDPSAVLAGGYLPENFTDGPLLTAMRGAGLLYLEELNRIPEETLNVLITVLTEGEIAVPRLGTVHATSGFRLIAAMNPFDAIGTARVGQAIADRMCRVVLDYQPEEAERAIVAGVTGAAEPQIALAVGLVRATRAHRDLRTGSSVRGAIDLVLLLDGLLRMRGEQLAGGRETARDATHAALSGRIRVTEGVERTPEAVLDEILDDVWPVGSVPPEPGGGSPGEAPDLAGGGQGKAPGPSAETGTEQPSIPRRDAASRRGPSSTGRREMQLRHQAFSEVSPEVGELDEDAFAGLMGADPDAAAALLADLATATDRELRSAARRLAARVFVQVGRVGTTRARGTRRLVPTRRPEGDLDLDRTLDRWSGIWPPAAEDLVTRNWTGSRRAVCLVVDRSGSMQGLGVAIAAVAAAGVVLAADERLQTSVLTFADDLTVLQALGRHRAAEDVVLDLVGLRGHGKTDLAVALRGARRQLSPATADERVVVLLSDCLSTAGEPAETALAGIDRLHVLCPLPSGEALDAARLLAARGNGRMEPVRSLNDLGPALTRLLG
ncbi:AAA family ATPase [Blastococcus sp. TML/M2B]|uniref:AAA family ATPase n=1 Tax=unclassified Blastococcus TaxID=2619396 RepID=UPI00190B6CA1|nr:MULTISPECIES: AAA family ATPase [unclassified Blastococcus]MBN1094317.1 AAA family ATPase [Blastococcus sp. TML/M2B]MBN1095566.1 AAA family ATPase [Blastococcus sp. TML/C7B]